MEGMRSRSEEDSITTVPAHHGRSRRPRADDHELSTGWGRAPAAEDLVWSIDRGGRGTSTTEQTWSQQCAFHCSGSGEGGQRAQMQAYRAARSTAVVDPMGPDVDPGQARSTVQ
jgi:hypothetical protein